MRACGRHVPLVAPFSTPSQRPGSSNVGGQPEERDGDRYLVALVEPTLAVALELVIQDEALDVGAAFQQSRLGLFAGAIDLEVVFVRSRSRATPA